MLERKIGVEITPLRINIFDKSELPNPLPFFYLLFAQDRAIHCVVEFGVNQYVNAVSPRETRDKIGPMLPSASGEIAGNTDIKRSVAPACQDVNAWTLFDHPSVTFPGSPLSRGRRLILIYSLLVASLTFASPARADDITEHIAVLQGLDKTTARVATIDAPVGQTVRYQNLLITARACLKHPPEETPESSAFLEIDELPPDAGPGVKPDRIFSGWMFASSPALSALENPVYDVSVLDCKDTETPAASAQSAPASPPAPSPAAPGFKVSPSPRPGG